MQFLAVIRRRTEQFTQEQFDAVLEPEAERVRLLYKEGGIRAVYSRGDKPGAVVQLECNDYEEALHILESLPFAQHGMLEIELVPLLPYRGFGPR